MCIKVWNIKSEDRPHSEILRFLSISETVILIILKEIYRKTTMINIETIEPNSSVITAII